MNSFKLYSTHYKKSISFFSLLIILMILIGCDEQLNLNPPDAPSSATFFSNEEELELAVNGMYEATLFWSLNGQPAWQSLDDMTDLGFERSTGSIKSVADGSASTTNNVFVNTWTHFYTAIARVNTMLDNVSRAEGNISQDKLNQFTAEARFLRAYSYSFLTELFGDVPLLTTVPDLDESEIGRTPKEAVVDQIIEDLDFAVQNLPASFGGSDEGRATRGAALTLKARVALYNERWEMAAETASQVIESGEYELYPDYRNMFMIEGERNSEVILDVPYLRGVATHNIPRRQQSRNLGAWSQHVPSQFIVDSYRDSEGKPIDESSIYDPENPFQNRDPRLDDSIVRDGAILGGFVFYTNPDSTETYQIIGGDSVRVQNQDVTNAFATFTGYLWRKYSDPDAILVNDAFDDSEQNFILIRFAEALLTYAEAKIEMNEIDQSVLEAMNRVRARGFGALNGGDYPEITTTDQSELRRILRSERKVEFANEGFRLFDIRRWGIADEVMSGPLVGRPRGGFETIPRAPNIDDETGHPTYEGILNLFREVEQRQFNPNRDFLWAIPRAEIDVNDEITQNPGY